MIGMTATPLYRSANLASPYWRLFRCAPGFISVSPSGLAPVQPWSVTSNSTPVRPPPFIFGMDQARQLLINVHSANVPKASLDFFDILSQKPKMTHAQSG